MEPLSTILAHSVNDPLPDLPNISEMYNLVWEHSTEKRQGSDSSLQSVLTSALHWEPQSTILAFSEYDPSPNLPNVHGTGYIGL